MGAKGMGGKRPGGKIPGGKRHGGQKVGGQKVGGQKTGGQKSCLRRGLSNVRFFVSGCSGIRTHVVVHSMRTSYRCATLIIII